MGMSCSPAGCRTAQHTPWDRKCRQYRLMGCWGLLYLIVVGASVVGFGVSNEIVQVST